MKQLEGYVFLAKYDSSGITFENIFGPEMIEERDKGFKNISGNGLNFYDSLPEATIYRKKYASLFQRAFSRLSTSTGFVQLSLAESLQEARENFSNEGKLIVIAQLEETYQFLGPSKGGETRMGSTINGTDDLSWTGWRSFEEVQGKNLKAIEWAERAAFNCSRQAASKGHIAKWELRRLK
jgi:hypothetical protein